MDENNRRRILFICPNCRQGLDEEALERLIEDGLKNKQAAWTSTPPTEPGYYWFRHNPQLPKEPLVIQLEAPDVAWVFRWEPNFDPRDGEGQYEFGPKIEPPGGLMQ